MTFIFSRLAKVMNVRYDILRGELMKGRLNAAHISRLEVEEDG
jgi:hypothetical protein